MSQPKVLFLGGAYSQVPIIKEAKDRGWYIITCDYLPGNPGHKYADEYFNVSTTDFDGVLQIAKTSKPDFIIAYASDPAAPTAAWVSEQLGLPGNPYKSTRILAEKDLFRGFLKMNDFNSPETVTIKSATDIEKSKKLKFPIIIKPTDSSGSKGVTRVDDPLKVYDAVDYALKFSRNKRIIAEEFIDNELGDLHGDGFVSNGELIFCALGDHIYNKGTNIYNPCGTMWPSRINKKVIEEINSDLKRLIKLSGFRNGAINIEARYSKNNKSYIMEIGPRSGGHFVPQAIKYGTGFDMVSAILDSYAGLPLSLPNCTTIGPSAYYALHSDKEGILKEIIVHDSIKPFIKEYHQYKHAGDRVESFQGANAALGIVLLLFNSIEEMDFYILNMERYIEVKLVN